MARPGLAFGGQTVRVDALETKIPPVLQMILAAAVTWGLSRIDAPVGFLDNGPTQLGALALGLIAGGLLLDAVGGFLTAKTSVDPHRPDKASELVSGGVYRFTRNPMYLGMALVVVGVALWLGTVVGMIGPALLVASLTRLQIVPEERYLEAAFGDDYRAFRTRVRRWI